MVREWRKRTLGLLVALGLALGQKTTITFYYPVGVAGPLARFIEAYVADFEKANPDIEVKTVFGGNYEENQAKVVAAIKAGTPPDTAVLLSQQLFTLLSMDAIEPFDPYIARDPELKRAVSDFFPAFMMNSTLEGKVYSLPFQRSTPILYYNKEAFREAGLDPNKPPATWDELVEYAKRLTKRDAQGRVVRYGVAIPTEDRSTWLLEGLVIQAGGLLYDPQGRGCKVLVDTEPVRQAMQFKRDLAAVHKVSPEGVIAWGTTPGDFAAGKVAMIYHSTGSLGFIRDNARFEFGTAFQPKKVRYGVPTGGANFYLFKGSDPKKREATLRFIKFMTSPELQARWSIDSGYVAARRASWSLPIMKEYVKKWPQALTAREQLAYAKAELPVYNLQQVKDIIAEAEQAVVLGRKDVREATREAQARVDQALAPYCRR
ncbi:ABC transporter substrate-binding protein [Thermus thermophilus]|uniref:ABC transporter substrate-binding protein n=1 Tax=Thermus thermophilus TaxID=274 RepID=UPI0009DC3981|nr:ABC transporter substrate-binding protein [Thermus thermophilus]BDG25341.1 ABC transporter substrate-binding protein [Thermus thermophilus]BDG27671.1 ABC transporter substrate-binding protein [Thermus thermophilus]BDG29901.1 ABC transporter substrate-binding protein [Thermus thermophilus]